METHVFDDYVDAFVPIGQFTESARLFIHGACMACYPVTKTEGQREVRFTADSWNSRQLPLRFEIAFSLVIDGKVCQLHESGIFHSCPDCWPPVPPPAETSRPSGLLQIAPYPPHFLHPPPTFSACHQTAITSGPTLQIQANGVRSVLYNPDVAVELPTPLTFQAQLTQDRQIIATLTETP